MASFYLWRIVMKVLYCSDLHGHYKKYEKLLQLHNNYDLVIIGGDILPYYSEVPEFLRGFLNDFFMKIQNNLLIDFANDDYMCFYKDFKQLVNKYSNIHRYHKKLIKIGNVSFIGMNYVPDYPFQLKDWCRAEIRDYMRIDPYQKGTPVISTKLHRKFIEINNLEKYYTAKKTIKEELYGLPLPQTKRVVYIFHAPPSNIGLDVCYDGRYVGSNSIRSYIEKVQPLLTLHGHIHENYNVTGLYYNKINNTICIQPGQDCNNSVLAYCEFDLDNIEETIIRKSIC